MENALLGAEILAAHRRTRGSDSADCLHSDLADHGRQEETSKRKNSGTRLHIALAVHIAHPTEKSQAHILQLQRAQITDAGIFFGASTTPQ